MWESKISCTIYLTKSCPDSDGSWYAIENCWSDNPHLFFLSSDLYSRGRTQRTWFHQEVLTFWHLQTNFFFKLDLVMDTTVLFCLIPIWMTLTFIQGHNCMRKQKLPSSFSCKFLWIWRKFSVLAWSVGMSKCMLNFVCMITVQVVNFAMVIFIICWKLTRIQMFIK